MRKISEEIKLGKLKIGKITFLSSDCSIKGINKKISKSVKKLKDFYNKNISNINIELIYSKKEFNKK